VAPKMNEKFTLAVNRILALCDWRIKLAFE
jgi:hypothetical protein